ncbi:catalase/peroxidase HPI [Aquimarina sp. ERC-38]|uniref:catalase/peroxidase HPI n=1 Tax=Aquimarina sp. ERC-38 TaxID=2949996 RepID=UPI002246E1A9|nr:catalase/peroxidase HPI [Aquimarina sp. ERC-38]UZO81932.1 catalase/peroxidase HPI [Aquimarina sp. ERC-38]
MKEKHTNVWDINHSSATAKCPFLGGTQQNTAGNGTSVRDWWPNELKLNILRQHSEKSNPFHKDFDYAKAFNSIDFPTLKNEVIALMTNSQEWWPADYGHYGPFLIRMAWHSAGTYRIGDGRGGSSSGSQRFAPLNSWPDNGNLDKARLLLWPVKKKYGKSLSWADLMILAGNCALESMGFKTFGYGAGREDIWEPEQDIYWGSETEWLANDKRYAEGRDKLEAPLGATNHGLIYVNPEGPDGTSDPIGSARDMRETFGRMAMNDEEIVALTAGGHTFGKAHGAADPDRYVGPEPHGAPMEQMSMGWKNHYNTGVLDHAITSGLEGAWTPTPTQWDDTYFKVLLEYDWELTVSPAGASQWTPTQTSGAPKAPTAGDASKSQALMMTDADMALKIDPEFLKISKRFKEHPEQLEDAFARAWYKLTHRDMGPVSRYLGPEVPTEELLWQDPLPETNGYTLNDEQVASLKNSIWGTGLSVSELVSISWASASTFRNSDKRGGANGGRIRLAPQNNWEVNNPEQLHKVLNTLKSIQDQSDFEVSMADLIVLCGSVGIEQAAKEAGKEVQVPFTPGRVDALQEKTDVDSFGYLEPRADGFRNYVSKAQEGTAAEEMLIDRAQLLDLSIPEMTALVGGLRVLDANYDGSKNGVFTDKPGVLSNDFFTNLLDFTYTWRSIDENSITFKGKNRITGEDTYTATRADLIFGSNTELRAIAEEYAAEHGGEELFIEQFINAFVKVMNADRFDLKS